jgi:hypothetical protein
MIENKNGNFGGSNYAQESSMGIETSIWLIESKPIRTSDKFSKSFTKDQQA